MKILVPVDVNRGKYDNVQTNMSSISPAAVYSEPHLNFRSAKLYVQTTINNGVTCEHIAREILAVHNGVDAFLTEYATVSTNENSPAMGDVFSADVSGSNFVLFITPSTTDSRAVIVSSIGCRDSGIC